MSERQKLDLGGLKPLRERPDPDTLRRLSEESGFPSRDPAPPMTAPPADARTAVAEPAPAPAAPPATTNITDFRRPGRPPSDRLIAINVRVSQETAETIYRIRDSKPRQSLADVIDTLVAFYNDHNTPRHP